ncbi:cache domain-containing protein [Hoeflea sp.]|uniref:cache domain-containing protein n=1 Tax=Hoeflea sp. TaxID=1940281 RepID=UPI003749B316
MKKLALSLFMTATLCSFASASENATKDEAQAMAVKAAAFLQENGTEKASEAFQTKGTEWFDRDLYVLVLKKGTGFLVAHGDKPAMAGRDLIGLKDANGKEFVKELAAVENEGWVDYDWQNPATTTIEPKSTFCKAADENLVCVGAYR